MNLRESESMDFSEFKGKICVVSLKEFEDKIE